MKRSILTLVLSLLVFAPAAFAFDHCLNYQFCGSLQQLRADGPSTTAGYGFVARFCSGPHGESPCYTGNVSCPSDGSSCQYQAGSLVTGCMQPYQTWYVSAYSWDGSNWGQDYVTIATVSSQPDCPLSVYTIGVPPRPFPPELDIPRNDQLVQASPYGMTVVFKDNAIDPARNSPSWPVTYVVSQKYWQSGTSEPGEGAYRAVWSGPCSHDGDGSLCNGPKLDVSVTGEYRVKVEVRMNVSASFAPSLAPVVYTNVSRGNHYTVYPGGRCLGCR
jgi:hypothetical protein